MAFRVSLLAAALSLTIERQTLLLGDSQLFLGQLGDCEHRTGFDVVGGGELVTVGCIEINPAVCIAIIFTCKSGECGVSVGTHFLVVAVYQSSQS